MYLNFNYGSIMDEMLQVFCTSFLDSLVLNPITQNLCSLSLTHAHAHTHPPTHTHTHPLHLFYTLPWKNRGGMFTDFLWVCICRTY